MRVFGKCTYTAHVSNEGMASGIARGKEARKISIEKTTKKAKRLDSVILA